MKRPTRRAAEEAVRTLLTYIGEDPAREGLRDTPARVVRAYDEHFVGYGAKPRDLLGRTFGEVRQYDEIVLLKGIDFESRCEHHMEEIRGIAHVAYLPDKRVVGISKLARVVDAFAKRLQVQERMTREIAEAVAEHLKPRGVGVVLVATHGCMSSRGVHKRGVSMVTSAMLGLFRTEAAARSELMSLIGPLP